ncbi:hypothetical protein ACRRTK_021261 [Alexandromys fortis]
MVLSTMRRLLSLDQHSQGKIKSCSKQNPRNRADDARCLLVSQLSFSKPGQCPSNDLPYMLTRANAMPCFCSFGL